MIGDNKLTLNTATMIDALQEYINLRWDKTSSGDEYPRVIDVQPGDHGSGTFIVSLKSPTYEETK